MLKSKIAKGTADTLPRRAFEIVGDGSGETSKAAFGRVGAATCDFVGGELRSRLCFVADAAVGDEGF